MHSACRGVHIKIFGFLPGVNFQNGYTYDAASNRKTLTAPDGSTNTYNYDTLNRLDVDQLADRPVRLRLRRAEPENAADAAQRPQHHLHLRLAGRGC